MPSLLNALDEELEVCAGGRFPRLQAKAYNLDDERQFGDFVVNDEKLIKVPFSESTVCYNPSKRTGVALTHLGASKAIALGAYHYALNKLGL